jgi:hypothetical protein
LPNHIPRGFADREMTRNLQGHFDAASEERKRAWERKQCIVLNFKPADDHKETLLRETLFIRPWSLYTMSISVLKMIDNNQGSRRSESQADMYLLVFVPGGVEAFMLSRQATLDEALIDRTCN